jgi:hypothetical protein
MNKEKKEYRNRLIDTWKMLSWYEEIHKLKLNLEWEATTNMAKFTQTREWEQNQLCYSAFLNYNKYLR